MDSSIASLRLENLKKISHFTWWNDPHKVYTFLEHEEPVLKRKYRGLCHTQLSKDGVPRKQSNASSDGMGSGFSVVGQQRSQFGDGMDSTWTAGKGTTEKANPIIATTTPLIPSSPPPLTSLPPPPSPSSPILLSPSLPPSMPFSVPLSPSPPLGATINIDTITTTVIIPTTNVATDYHHHVITANTINIAAITNATSMTIIVIIVIVTTTTRLPLENLTLASHDLVSSAKAIRQQLAEISQYRSSKVYIKLKDVHVKFFYGVRSEEILRINVKVEDAHKVRLGGAPGADPQVVFTLSS
ncbi:hypothetical protein JHK86_001446 [Glycine max]|nr:hypothetical protein JHK86_001446 [Glycine max]